ncbi:MAG: hypothetical protein ACTS5Y_11285, partial [Pollutimonas bauzanensis]
LRPVRPDELDVSGILKDVHAGQDANWKQSQRNALRMAGEKFATDPAGAVNELRRGGLLDQAAAVERLGMERERHPLSMDATRAQIAAARGSEGRAAGLYGPNLEAARLEVEKRKRELAIPIKPPMTIIPPGGTGLVPDPGAPDGFRRIAGPPKPPDPTMRRAIDKATDDLPNLAATITQLREARDLVRRASHGYLSTTRAAVRMGTDGWVPTGMDKSTAEATGRLNQILSGEAIAAMAASLTGATTNFELMEFKRILADSSVTPQVKQQVIDQMLRKAEQSYKINMDRIRGYGGAVPGFAEDVLRAPGAGPSPVSGGPSVPSGAPPADAGRFAGPRLSSKAEYDALPSGATFIAPDGSTRRKP